MTVNETPLLDRIFHVLAGFPSPEDVLNVSLTEQESARIKELTELNLNQRLSAAEKNELDQYLMGERYVRLAKANALLLMNR